MRQQINLFNPRFQARTMVFGALATVRALAVLLLGCVALALAGQYLAMLREREVVAGAARLAIAQARLDKVNVEFAPRLRSKTLAAELVGVEAKSALLRDAAGAIERGELGNKVGHAGLFKALARQASGGIWLTGVRIAGDDGAMALQGRALDAALVPAYLLRLGHEPLLQGRRFGSMHIGVPKGAAEGAATVIEFSLDSVVDGGRDPGHEPGRAPGRDADRAAGASGVAP